MPNLWLPLCTCLVAIRGIAHTKLLSVSNVPYLSRPCCSRACSCPSSASSSLFNRRQNDLERYRVIQSMEKMRQNPAKAVKGISCQIECCVRVNVLGILALVCGAKCCACMWLRAILPTSSAGCLFAFCRDHLESANALFIRACSPLALSLFLGFFFVFPPVSRDSVCLFHSRSIFPLSSFDPPRCAICASPSLHLCDSFRACCCRSFCFR